MSNYGLIGNIAGGIRETMNQYQTMQNMKRQKKMMGLLQGVQENPITGEMDFTPEQKQKRDLEMRLLQSQIAKNYRGRADELDLTPGQKAADTTFGKEYADYGAGGGSATIDKNMGLLRGAIDKLEGKGGSKVETGGLSGYLPEWGQDLVASDVANVRDDIRSAIQTSLKQILGGQYTEREGKAIFERAFNPRLSSADNVKKAQAELAALESMAGQKDQAIRYFEKNGTLTGFKPMGLLKKKESPPPPGGDTAGNDSGPTLEELIAERNKRKKVAGQ